MICAQCGRYINDNDNDVLIVFNKPVCSECVNKIVSKKSNTKKHDYTLTWPELMLVDMESALIFFNQKKQVFLLYDDGTKILAVHEYDIREHAAFGGKLGVAE